MKAVWDQPDSQGRRRRRLWHVLPLLAALGLVYQALHATSLGSSRTVNVPLHAEETLAKCRSLHVTPGPPDNFSRRRVSDRFVAGTKPVLLRNAHVWTGGNNGTEILDANILLEGGIIRAIGRFPPSITGPYEELEVIDLKGAWVTPGIVDVHSHIGDGSAPALEGADDTNSLKGTTQPWLRSLDGLNTHDDSYTTSISGGVTTANVLPGSANAIGGQAFTIKLRRTVERSPTSMLLEAPFTINGTAWEDLGGRPRWRQLKQACGENPSRVYGDTRMDTAWAFRAIYNEARKIKEAQDNYCSKAVAHEWAGLKQFPDALEYEALVDVLRGRVRVHTHCYEAVDFDALIRLSQEFKFPIAATHHASEAFLVPDLLKSAYGHPPAVALFATNARYKREAYRGSEFAPRILTQHGLSVVMKSDHSVLNERDLLFEAQQAFYYGLPWNVALASVTSTSADVLGYGHRIGYIKRGHDADLVVWDSHPLALGATPKMVFIDGISQLENAHVLHKPDSFQKLPEVPNFDHEAEEAVKYEGLPPLLPTLKEAAPNVLFTNVAEVIQSGQDTPSVFSDKPAAVLVRDGKIVCMSANGACAQLASDADAQVVDLEGGSIQPGLTTYGAPHGVVEIDQERSTNDGYVFDAMSSNLPSILNGMVPRAIDGLSFQGRDTLYAYRAGVTTAISAPRYFGLIGGLGVAFSTGAAHKLEPGAIVQRVTALHVTVSLNSPISVSTQIGTLRRLLFGHGTGKVAEHFKQVAEGGLTLVVEAHSADVISSLILLKREVEAHTHSTLKFTITHASEAHLLASELGHAGIGVVLLPARPFPFTWEDRRILPGPPLSEKSQVRALHEANVTVAIGVLESWDSRNTPFYLGWVALEANGTLSRREALALGSTNVQKLLGADVENEHQDLVATRGGDLLTMQARVVAHIAPSQSKVVLL